MARCHTRSCGFSIEIRQVLDYEPAVALFAVFLVPAPGSSRRAECWEEPAGVAHLAGSLVVLASGPAPRFCCTSPSACSGIWHDATADIGRESLPVVVVVVVVFSIPGSLPWASCCVRVLCIAGLGGRPPAPPPREASGLMPMRGAIKPIAPYDASCSRFILVY